VLEKYFFTLGLAWCKVQENVQSWRTCSDGGQCWF